MHDFVENAFGTILLQWLEGRDVDCDNTMCLQHAKGGVSVPGMLEFHRLLPHLSFISGLYTKTRTATALTSTWLRKSLHS